MPGSDTPHLHQTVTNPSQAGWNQLTDGLLIIVLYVVAVCGALLFSGYRDVVIFGAVNLVAVIVIAWLTVSGFASIWCAWAAVSSAAITPHLRLATCPPPAGG